MTWVKIDDGFAEHPKVLRVGLEGLGLQIAALCYSNRQLTDGLIDRLILPRITGLGAKASEAWAKRMVAAGLWEEEPLGYRIHDYLEYQQSRATILAKRAEDSRRKNKNSARNPDGKTAESAPPIPSDPIPSDPIPSTTHPPARRRARNGRELGEIGKAMLERFAGGQPA